MWGQHPISFDLADQRHSGSSATYSLHLLRATPGTLLDNTEKTSYNVHTYPESTRGEENNAALAPALLVLIFFSY